MYYILLKIKSEMYGNNPSAVVTRRLTKNTVK